MRYGDTARPFQIFLLVLLLLVVTAIVTLLILIQTGGIKLPPHKFDPASSRTTPVPDSRDLH